MKTISVIFAITPLILAGCGGGEATSIAPTVPTPVSSLTQAKSLQDAWGAAPLTAAVPATGSATYSGAAVFGSDTSMAALLNAPELSADARLNADFASGAVSGTIDNFRNTANTSVGGALTLSGGTIAGNAIVGSMDGNVGDRTIDGDLAGRFLGAGAEAVSGQITGTDAAGASFTGALIVAR